MRQSSSVGGHGETVVRLPGRPGRYHSTIGVGLAWLSTTGLSSRVGGTVQQLLDHQHTIDERKIRMRNFFGEEEKFEAEPPLVFYD